MESIFGAVEGRAEAFVKSNATFRERCGQIFDGLEGKDGKIALADVRRAVDILFDLLAGQLDQLGIAVSRPSPAEVQGLLDQAHGIQASGLDEDQFRVGNRHLGKNPCLLHGS